MAKQAGKYLITGTIDDLTFYKMDGQYYVRCKSTLCSKRVKKSKAFAGTMKSARELGIASRIASKVYRGIDRGVRYVSLYRKLTGMAKLLMKKGVDTEDIKRELELYVATVFDCNSNMQTAPKELKTNSDACKRPIVVRKYLPDFNRSLHFRSRQKYNKKRRPKVKGVFGVRSRDGTLISVMGWVNTSTSVKKTVVTEYG